MKVFICADIEGVGCVVRSEHSSPSGRDYTMARELMTGEVNAATKGAFEGGATEVMVADSHNVGLNLIPERLDNRIRLVMGGPRPLAMMEGIQRGFDRVFFVGAHAMAGTSNSSIVHIFHGRVAKVLFNNVPMGEIGINAALAGYFGAPVALVTGDDKACEEARALLSGVETVEVKSGVGAYAAMCLHPERCRQLIFEGAKKTMNDSAAGTYLFPEGPITLEIGFTTASTVDRVLRMPGVERLDGLTVRYEGQNYLEAFKAFNTMVDLIELAQFI